MTDNVLTRSKVFKNRQMLWERSLEIMLYLDREKLEYVCKRIVE